MTHILIPIEPTALDPAIYHPIAEVAMHNSRLENYHREMAVYRSRVEAAHAAAKKPKEDYWSAENQEKRKKAAWDAMKADEAARKSAADKEVQDRLDYLASEPETAKIYASNLYGFLKDFETRVAQGYRLDEQSISPLCSPVWYAVDLKKPALAIVEQPAKPVKKAA